MIQRNKIQKTTFTYQPVMPAKPAKLNQLSRLAKILTADITTFNHLYDFHTKLYSTWFSHLLKIHKQINIFENCMTLYYYTVRTRYNEHFVRVISSRYIKYLAKRILFYITVLLYRYMVQHIRGESIVSICLEIIWLIVLISMILNSLFIEFSFLAISNFWS